MEIKASLSRTWRNRQLMIAGFLAAFALWFIYDGAIGYPAKNEQHLAYEQLKEEGRSAEWPEVSREKNWPRKPPEHGFDAEQIRQQYWMAGITLAFSGVALGVLLFSRNRTMRGDDTAAYSASGQRVPYSAFTAVNKKKWDSKGIALAFYEENGRTGKLVIDDYKYTGAEAILARIEQELSGDAPAPPPSAEASGQP